MNNLDPRIIKTKKQIEQSLLENLSKYPFQKITIDMICKGALINRSTFYKHYVDKYDLWDKYLTRILDDFKEQTIVDFVLASPSNVGAPIYINIFRNYAQYLYQNKDMYMILWHASLDRPIYDEMILIIRDKILDSLCESNKKLEKDNVYIDLYAYLFASNTMSLIHWWFKNERTVTLQDIMHIMTKNMEEGLFKTFKDYFIPVIK